MKAIFRAISFLIILLNTTILFSQVTIKNNVITIDSKKLDKVYGIAKNYAYEGKRDTARKICYKILEFNKDYYDAKLLIGRTYAWDNKFDSARSVYRRIIYDNKVKNKKEAIDGIIDVETWNENTDSALYYCYYGLAKCRKDSNDFLLRVANIYLKDGDSEGAKKQVNIVLERDSMNGDAHKMLELIDSLNLPDKLQLEYLHEWFNDPYYRRFNLYSLSYEKQTKVGPLIGRIYYGRIINTATNDSLLSDDIGMQFEISAYPKISKDYYGFLLLSVSPDFFFPKYRIAVELFRKLPYSSEVSLGFRKMGFQGGGFNNNVTVYTGSLSKYFGDLWMCFRPYMTVSDVSTGFTYTFEARKFYNTRDHFVFAQLAMGSSPDEPANLVHTPVFEQDYTLRSSKLKFGYQRPFLKNWLFYAAFGIESGEYKPEFFHTIYSIELRLGYYFR